MTTTTLSTVLLPIAIEYYGDISETEYEFLVNYNREKLSDAGLKLIKSYNQGTDSEKELWSVCNSENKYQFDEIDIWEGLSTTTQTKSIV